MPAASPNTKLLMVGNNPSNIVLTFCRLSNTSGDYTNLINCVYIIVLFVCACVCVSVYGLKARGERGPKPCPIFTGDAEAQALYV